MEKKKIFILGNPLLDCDSLPIKLAAKLKKYFPNTSFVHLDPTEGINQLDYSNPVFIDTVWGIDKVTIFDGLDSFSSSSSCTVHDYDLLVDLILLKKLGKIKKATIIGVPAKGDLEMIETKVKQILRSKKL